MSEYLIQDSTLTNIANSIRGKTGKSEPILTENMATEIDSITGGGGGNCKITEIVVDAECTNGEQLSNYWDPFIVASKAKSFVAVYKKDFMTIPAERSRVFLNVVKNTAFPDTVAIRNSGGAGDMGFNWGNSAFAVFQHIGDTYILLEVD